MYINEHACAYTGMHTNEHARACVCTIQTRTHTHKKLLSLSNLFVLDDVLFAKLWARVKQAAHLGCTNFQVMFQNNTQKTNIVLDCRK